MGAAAHRVQGDAPTTVRCPLFESMVGGFDDDRRHVVCDLGPARSGTVALLGRFRCRLEILSLPHLLPTLLTCETAAEVEALVRTRLPHDAEEPVDALLCWNLLNYLTPAIIAPLMRVLAERLAPGGLVHALIEYSAAQMPGQPARIAPSGPGELLIEPDDAAPCPAPRYALGALEKCLPGLKSERAMLLGNGMQEYLFRRSSAVR